MMPAAVDRRLQCWTWGWYWQPFWSIVTGVDGVGKLPLMSLVDEDIGKLSGRTDDRILLRRRRAAML